MADIKAVKEKIDSVASLKKITKAMEMVARSKMKKATDAAVATRMYATYALELLVHLSGDVSLKNPYLKQQGAGNKQKEKVLVLHIASNKGLCGGYNVSILRAAGKYFQNKDVYMDFVTVGRYAYRHALKLGGNVVERFDDFSDNLKASDVSELTSLILEKFKTGEYGEAYIVYTNFISIFNQEVVVRRLLPVSEESMRNVLKELGEDSNKEGEHVFNNNSLYLYEPGEEEILELIVPRLIKMQIYQSLLEANASEHSARMVAMKSATDSADKIGDQLLLTYNKARQEGITKEILEIASGAEALN